MVPVFQDRHDAATQLARRLGSTRGAETVVFGIPRGGVAVAAEIARDLGATLDIIVARKVGAPWQPELAIGAVTASGGQYLNAELIEEAGVSAGYVRRAVDRALAEARYLEDRLRSGQPAVTVTGRTTAIVVDDGLATGATMRAAVQALREHTPERIVVAVPVGAAQTCTRLRQEADAVVTLYEPDPFLAVGLYYEDFRPLTERDVERLLGRST